MLVLAYLFTRRLVAPIRNSLSPPNGSAAIRARPRCFWPVPPEIGDAARAFNAMQDRLRSYVEDRTRMLGVIAHDLRTPLTRLTFRLEDAPGNLRERAAGDIAEVDAMIKAVAAFVRDDAEPTRREPVELGPLVAGNMAEKRRGGDDVRKRARHHTRRSVGAPPHDCQPSRQRSIIIWRRACACGEALMER